MNLIYGKVLKIFEEHGIRMGVVRVGGARAEVALGLLDEVAPGDEVLFCDRVAIGKVNPETDEAKEE